MSLDDRGLRILKLLVDNPMTTGINLEKQTNLSRKQISYSLEKINYYLIENGYKEISRLKTGKFIIDNGVIQDFKTSNLTELKSEYVFNETERIELIIIILLQRIGDLSMNHFVSLLKVSKNTLLNDFKKLQGLKFDKYNLRLTYDRQNGYRIVGKEYDKRLLLISSINNIFPMLQEKSVYNVNLGINYEMIKQLNRDVEEVEKVLNVRYTDERILLMPYILYFTLIRSKHHKVLDIVPDNYLHTIGTKEYIKISNIFDKYGITDAFERVFLVMQFQMSSFKYLSIDEKQLEGKIYHICTEVLKNIKNLICVDFQDEEALLNALFQHCRPAVYRAMYNFHFDDTVLKMVIPQHQHLFELTKHALIPFKEILNEGFPDNEIAYITILLGGWLTKEGSLEKVERKKKAIVVCTNGISISNFLFIKLKEAFPEFKFIQSLSKRQFNEIDEDFDLIFSTVYLETKIPQFIVKPVLSSDDILTLRKKVFKSMNLNYVNEVNSSSIMYLIEKYADIVDKKALKRALVDLLDEEKQEVEYSKISLGENGQETKELCDLLNENTIQMFNEKESDWKEIIHLACEPLLKNQVIEECYIDEIIRLIKIDKPIWCIADGIMLAHAGINQGVNKLGFSMMKCDKKVNFNDYMEADCIVVIATPSVDIHLKALNSLINITEDHVLFKRFKEAKKKEEIIEIILEEKK